MDMLADLKEAVENMEEVRKKCRCPYRQDLQMICFETCGKGNAVDCEIYLQRRQAYCVTCGVDTNIEFVLTSRPHMCK